MIQIRKIKNILAIIITISIFAPGVVTVSAGEGCISGTWADNVTWEFKNGIMTLSGTGDMQQINNSGVPDWTIMEGISNDSIEEAMVEEGITGICMYTFYGCSNMASVALPSTLKKIEGSAFQDCTGLTHIYYNGTLEQWEKIEIGEYNTPLFEAVLYTEPGSAEEKSDDSDSDNNDNDNTSKESGFDETLFRANYLAHFPEKWQRSQDNLEFFKPCSILLSDKHLNASTTTWKVVTGIIDTAFSPSKGLDLAFEEKDIYSALILELLESESEFDIINEFFTDQNYAGEMLSFMNDYASGMYHLDLLDQDGWKSMTPEQMENLSKAVDVEFNGDYSFLSGMGLFLDSLNTVTDFVDYTDAILDYIVSVMCLKNIIGAKASLLNQLYDYCPDSYGAMKDALKDCISIINASGADLVLTVTQHIAGMADRFGAREALKLYGKIVTGKVEIMFPQVAFLKAVYDGGKLLCNFLMSTDKTVEQVSIMKAVVQLESLIDTVAESDYHYFCNNKNTEAAGKLLAAIDMQYAARKMDMEKAEEFAETIDKTVLNSAFGGGDAAFLQQKCREQKEDLLDFLYLVHTDWISSIDLYYQGSDLYQEYDTTYRQQMYKQITGREYPAVPEP